MKQTLLTVVISAVLLSGCTLTTEKKGTMSNAELQADLQKQQQEWEEMKPQLQRVLALESDLKLLVQTLDAVPESSQGLTKEVVAVGKPNSTSSPALQVQPTTALAPSASAMTTAPRTSEYKAPETGGVVRAQFYNSAKARIAAAQNSSLYYGVQLGAYATERQAIQGWQSITQRFAAEFADTAPLINRQPVKGKTYYQLIVGPFTQKAYSVDFCNKLKQMQKDCLITRYQGDPFLSL